MTRFRPCIDLHAGSVKQIVGGTLSTDNAGLKTNYTSEHPAAYFAELYRKNDLKGGHVIMLGPGNNEAAQEAIAAWPGGLQVGGGIKDSNAKEWIDAGAERVIITSYLFPSGTFSLERLQSVLDVLDGDMQKLVIDLSCRRVGDGWRVAMDRWQTITNFEINKDNIAMLEPYCSEFLIHAADAEGLQAGIDEKLVSYLSEICTIPVTYAGGGRNIQDLELVERLSSGRVDLTIGSALDIFGGKTVTFEECCNWNSQREGR
ncbi:1-(5-phosphoribosyl)-5-[(5-phosphoribosylamino)methylideneamino] imidazole-4-carboxamide isomerase [Fulvia fulva]|uniref:1-(5-phosphoribosyl)-5-[(5-phosphoribosylamino)methylideneamino] imidazole-4-carboxamide isomerase n=1 Tax=Passalora fulva TaxID=5499 RepID=A0A9Q8LJ98_PASFU|nr:1-(5-phosphoribosyl)-5-[(5-phosphoribosylamino)methylideneamino] imidazole-4-carboxamide isomerase [Fulvia fulva]KAK4621725.1 1-(5-phosphoribosyl)-5-[(5-phosphoribosylamino)methylideneamino] imidazole-4-carboxamide isomerase [Fulvia fulva]KAK4623178.1 1-(5-phosphoribosyl)-5-[(5-phosphoribosylamino)methylideneamino] imidazole-4-carboxamide isomerase [Fulvia fulva]UJO18431.1 1-(5-phosphoribosyl)-5-[(5-phosphoribosylamino)methylideneamino] imidazole-4-carboxamide isomerase [Fulvia fulva]WPV1673